MRKIVGMLVALASLILVLAPTGVTRADQQYGSITVAGGDINYAFDASVENSLQNAIPTAMGGWTNVSAPHWLGIGIASYTGTGLITELTSGWSHGSNYAGWTTFSADGNNHISSITTQLNHQNYSFNTGTVSGSTISVIDLMTHEFGFAISLHEGCYGNDTTANSVMCDINLTQNHSTPQSNDVSALQSIYR